MNGAIVYSSNSAMPMLHNLREFAEVKGNRALAYALSLAITEYTSHGDKSEPAQRLRRQSIEHYRKAVNL